MRVPALLVDLYELTMAQAYLDAGLAERPATFSLFVRTLPEGWRSFVAAGLEPALEYLEELRFGEDDLAYLEGTGMFSPALLERLRRLRFSGTVRALPEGTLFFPQEPVLEVTGPLLEAQLVETALLNVVHLHTLLASKAVRSVQAARGRRLVEFGLRRTHGAAAGLAAARSSWLAGFDATSNVLAGKLYGIPLAGTMAHSFVEAFEDELEAFRAFSRSYPDASTLLLDTYDTVEGARRAVVVARELAAGGHRLRGVRLDSGDLAALATRVRAILDEAGFADSSVFASGNLDEDALAALLAEGAPIGGFGVGTRMGTSAGAPYVDVAYKLVEVAGRPVMKLSSGKASWPGPKQVFRVSDGGVFQHDVLGLAEEEPPARGEPLLWTAMADGSRTGGREPLAAARARCAAQRAALAEGRYDVRESEALVALREHAEAEARRRAAG